MYAIPVDLLAKTRVFAGEPDVLTIAQAKLRLLIDKKAWG